MVNYDISKTCCFLGHRKVNISNEFKDALKTLIENLIVDKGITIFMFGSRSEFEDICYDIVSALKIKYSNICRIYVRAEYPVISKEYEDGLLKAYEDTYFPSDLHSDMFVYIKRNQEIINKSCFCVFYYNDKYVPISARSSHKFHMTNSGTGLAYEYAKSKCKNVINVYTSLKK